MIYRLNGFLLGLVAIILVGFVQDSAQLFRTSSGKVMFISDAPLEIISASSNELRGVLDTSKNIFAFSVALTSFIGFNNPLQREHFNENYMESADYPTATFSGKIIEDFDYSVKGKYDIRAKGVLIIRGVKHERIIRCNIEVAENNILVTSSFIVVLEDHNIKIPRVVFQKISPEIKVDIDASLKPVAY